MSLATEMLDLYIQAEKDVLAGKNITLRGETMGLEDLDKIREGRKEWSRIVGNESAGGRSYSLASFN
jgi:hypothetical protein